MSGHLKRTSRHSTRHSPKAAPEAGLGVMGVGQGGQGGGFHHSPLPPLPRTAETYPYLAGPGEDMLAGLSYHDKVEYHQAQQLLFQQQLAAHLHGTGPVHAEGALPAASGRAGATTASASGSHGHQGRVSKETKRCARTARGSRAATSSVGGRRQEGHARGQEEREHDDEEGDDDDDDDDDGNGEGTSLLEPLELLGLEGMGGDPSSSPATVVDGEAEGMDASGTGSGGLEDEKRRRRLMRNREAARRNRQKKKEWIYCLQLASTKAKRMNEELHTKVSALEGELQGLRNALTARGYVDAAFPAV